MNNRKGIAHLREPLPCWPAERRERWLRYQGKVCSRPESYAYQQDALDYMYALISVEEARIMSERMGYRVH